MSMPRPPLSDIERHGIWGGMTSEQRYRRARMRKIGVQ